MLVILLALLLAVAPAAAQTCTTTCYVDPAGDDVANDGSSPAEAFQTLAKAIATVQAGGTVQAAPGRYEPNFTDVPKSVVLRGAQAGVAVAGRDPADTDTESILRSNTGFRITGAGAVVTIDGFVFEEKTAGSSIGISAGAGITDVGATVTIEHCIFAGVNIGIAASSGTDPSSFAVTGNRWDGGGTGIQMMGDREDDATLTIDDNRFDDLDGTAVSILVWTGATVTDNTIDGQTGFGPAIGIGGCDGCLLARNTLIAPSGFESITVIGSNGPSTNCTVEDNTITNPTRAENFAIFVGIATGTVIDGNTITGAREAGIASDPASTITNNGVTSAGGAGTAGIILRGANTGSVIGGNVVAGAAVGVQIAAGAGSTNTHVTRNAIAGNTTGLANAAATTADATCNWWGAASGPSGAGPGTGDPVSANVTFAPFLTSSDLENAPCGAATTTSTTSTVIATTTTSTTAPPTTTTSTTVTTSTVAITTSTTTTTTASTTTLPEGPCPPTPRSGCVGSPAGRATLVLKRTGGAKDALAWQWRSGVALTKDVFGTPATTTGFVLCLYDASPEPRRVLAVPAAGTCRGGKPCWKSTKAGFTYKDKDATPDGIVTVVLKSGAAGKARIVVKGKGTALAVPPLPLTLPARVQLVRTDTLACWDASFSTAKKNTTRLLKAR